MSQYLPEYMAGGKECMRDDCHYIPLKEETSDHNVHCTMCGNSWHATILPRFEGRTKKEQVWYYK